MRKIITTTFVTLDGVMQAPGGPDEDRTGGFAYGGWMFNYRDDMTDKVIDEFMHLPFELLLGRKTYDIFASYWPHAKDDSNVAKPFNATKKYVVSHSQIDLPWKNSELITGDVVAQIKKLKDMDAPDLWIHGSGNLIQTLLANNLIDRMHVWIFPVTVGSGKRLFAEGTQPEDFKLVESKITPRGTMIGTFEPKGKLVVRPHDLN